MSWVWMMDLARRQDAFDCNGPYNLVRKSIVALEILVDVFLNLKQVRLKSCT